MLRQHSVSSSRKKGRLRYPAQIVFDNACVLQSAAKKLTRKQPRQIFATFSLPNDTFVSLSRLVKQTPTGAATSESNLPEKREKKKHLGPSRTVAHFLDKYR